MMLLSTRTSEHLNWNAPLKSVGDQSSFDTADERETIRLKLIKKVDTGGDDPSVRPCRAEGSVCRRRTGGLFVARISER